MDDWVVEVVGEMGCSHGPVLWTGMLAYLGLLLGQQFQEVDRYIGPVSWVVIAVAVDAYVYRVHQIRRAKRASGSPEP